MRWFWGLMLAGCAATRQTQVPAPPEEARIQNVPRVEISETPAAIPAPAASALLPAPEAAKIEKPEGHLAHRVCVGVDASKLKKERPHTAACCLPARELIVRPIRALFPELKTCYQAARPDAEGRVVFEFRVEQDGTVARVCTGDATTMDDESAARCMVGVMRKVRYPARDDADLDLCGLMHFNYPVTFER